ncbi:MULTISPECIES: hypothetical protein [unclassified Crossiella]|uniref:hypothetical protein n=1 Tax=unclassified Crossiella TaxID=2620835 RepID=UPI001FFEE8EE|nr:MULTISPECIES: hypothetical protein [unclassified Crossiella]MCK2241398.1 hypothetical protein [Crossiella sp. S99.2]MCK2253458.1 hypothetical protein [Crossiella sp. S99.1]
MKTLTRLGLGATALVAAFTLTACGGGENKGDGPASLNGGNKGNEQKAGDDVPKDPKAAMLKFASCMRENGVDFPDPDPESGGMARAIPAEGLDKNKMDKASEACKKYLPKSNYDPNDPKEKDRRAKMNQCLRDKGIEVKEAEGGNGATIDFGGDKEKAEKIMKECGMGMAGAGSAEPVK